MAAHATVISSFPAGKSLGLWSSYQCTGQNARGQSGSEAEISQFDREMQKYKAIGQGCFRSCIDLKIKRTINKEAIKEKLTCINEC